MPAFSLLKFQDEAIDRLSEAFLHLWAIPDRRSLPLVFKSPTGSGKTITIANFIRRLNHLPQWDKDKSFIWITFSDDLATQSKEKFEKYFENDLENTLLTVSDIGQGVLMHNDILFLNWQKVVQDNASSRKLKLRRPADDRFKKESGSYFEELIEETHKAGREIILIIDEAHTHSSTTLAQDIVGLIDPKIIIHVTATPQAQDIASSATLGSFIQVNRNDVVEEGLIKEWIEVQSSDDLREYNGVDLDKALLGLGLKKRLQLAEELKGLGKNINPLMLIQLPNDDSELISRGDSTKEQIVIDFLSSNGVSKNKIAKWFDKNKENLDFIEDNDSEVDFMLFKQAAGTGWDCPRASVLVMFREIKKEVFYTQTVGRILRMPEPQSREDYRDHPNLRTAFLYTNYKRSAIELPDIDKNKIPIYHPRLKEGIKNVEIQSAYISRIDYGDIPESYKFQRSLLNSVNSHFGINEDDLQNLDLSREKLLQAGLDLDGTLTNSIIADAKFGDLEQMAYEFKEKGVDIQLEMSLGDVEKTFNYLCQVLLKEQSDDQAKYTNASRAWGVLKSAVRVWLKAVVGGDCDYFYRVFIKDIQKGSSSKLRPAITQALIDFKPIAKVILEEKKKKEEEKNAPIFSIAEQYDYTSDYEEISQQYCALDKCYLLKDYLGKENELNFINYIEGKGDKIEWWFKNGNYGRKYFAIKYIGLDGKENLFYPDFIIRFKNGRIGIF